MQEYKDNQLITDENPLLELAALSVLGDRDDQQDCFGYALKNDEGLVIVCDGMGGHQGGRMASRTAVDCTLNAYSDENAPSDPMERMLCATRLANQSVCELKGANGEVLKAGSTSVAILIRAGMLLWCSVGDSRAYLFRNGEFAQLTQDHNYLTVLNERLNAGVIDGAEYERERVRGEALISFLGIGELNLIDYSSAPLPVTKDDKILIMSDGLYKLVSDEEIGRIIDNFSNMGDAVNALEMKAKKNAKKNAISRDNMTVALIKLK